MQCRIPTYIWISDKEQFFKCVPNIARDILILRSYWLFMWNSNLTGCPVFLFAKSSNSFHWIVTTSPLWFSQMYPEIVMEAIFGCVTITLKPSNWLKRIYTYYLFVSVCQESKRGSAGFWQRLFAWLNVGQAPEPSLRAICTLPCET